MTYFLHLNDILNYTYLSDILINDPQNQPRAEIENCFLIIKIKFYDFNL